MKEIKKRMVQDAANASFVETALSELASVSSLS
jgi:hypothetical protein